MRFSRRAFAKAGLITTGFLLGGFLIGGNIYVTNLRADRGESLVSIVPGSPTAGPAGAKGDKGDKGDAGERPSFSEIQTAVAEYCLATGACKGESPSPTAVYAAVLQYCQTTNCKGSDGIGVNGTNGVNGQDAPAITDEQIQTQVAAYCAANRCRGEDGATGATGSNGRTPVVSCVIRNDGRYIATKYSDELDTSYVNLYGLPVLTECANPVDLRAT